ncbi:glycosyltransferase family 2 protein [Paraflavitalea pollutisoli]|uniref:glycosyltransferase family 2 protein n=1 Tax=Paraflavitalea pollutisoli TaxID=3034143 RepID=UPI0023EABC32|nr:glycosyltransferase family 2 protein [Paraflavitalea sp. H1-2-19X]
MTQPLVSIVILNWNGRKFLEQFMPSVQASTYANKHIAVIDNASSDDSVAFLQAHYPNVQIVHNSGNHGFAKGYNEGLRFVKGDYFILLNSDVEVTPGWIEPVIALMESDPTIGACQPKFRQYHQRELFEYAGAAGGMLDYLGYPLARGRIFDLCEVDQGQYDDAIPIFWAGGAALFIRAAVYFELEGFDEYFFAHQEEIDLCWRLQLAGYQVYVCPQSVVYHVGGGTLPKGNARKVFLNFRNNLIMMAKNMPVGEALWKIPYRFLLDTVSAFKSLLEGQGRYFTAVFKAHVAFLNWWLFKQKQSVFPVSRKKKLQGYILKSVVWRHFVNGKKTFAEIIGDK